MPNAEDLAEELYKSYSAAFGHWHSNKTEISFICFALVRLQNIHFAKFANCQQLES